MEMSCDLKASNSVETGMVHGGYPTMRIYNFHNPKDITEDNDNTWIILCEKQSSCFFRGSFHSQIVGCFRCCMAIKKKTFFEYHIVLTDLCVCKTKVSHGESRDLVSWKSRDFHQLRRSPHLQFQGEFGSHFHLNHFALLLGAWSTMVGWGKLWQLHSTHHCYIRPAILFGAGKKTDKHWL